MNPKDFSSFFDLVKATAKRLEPILDAKLTTWYNKSVLKKLYKHIEYFGQVKTVWQADKSVDLLSFYVPSKIRTGDGIVQIENVDNLPAEPHILVQGIAGQGKSIFLRYLCVTELARGKFIPVFIELRNLNQDRDLMTQIMNCFIDYDLEWSDAVFQQLCAEGRLILLLDGFDETDETLIKRLIQDLETLCRRFPALRIIVTSRRGSQLRASAAFRVVELAPLRGNDYEKIIEKLAEDKVFYNKLIQAIASSRHGVRSLLTTPLLVTLLVITYKYYQVIPDSLSQFYELLFQLLLLRHDGTKPGYRRKRRCKLSDVEYRRAFEALCFYSKRSHGNKFTTLEMIAYAERALRTVNPTENASHFFEDICEITCLIVKDGTEVRYIHKSVQEYYAGCFIAKFTEARSLDFYGKVYADNGRNYRWRGEIGFLKEIDAYRYAKFVVVPYSRAIFGITPEVVDGEKAVRIIADRYLEALRSLPIAYERVENDAIWTTSEYNIPRVGPFSDGLENYLFEHFEFMKKEEFDAVGVSTTSRGESLGMTGENKINCTVGELMGQKETEGITALSGGTWEELKAARAIIRNYDEQEIDGVFES